MKKTILTYFGLLVVSFAFAFPPLQPYRQGSLQINVPLNWEVQIDEARATIDLQEDSSDPMSPEVFMISQENSNNVTPTIFVEEALRNLANAGFTDISIVETQYIEGGLIKTVVAKVQAEPVKAALMSFNNGNYITLAMFTAKNQRFDDLGGVALIYITVGGQDPAQFNNAKIANTNDQNQSRAMSPECSDPNSFLNDSDNCQYERLTLLAPRQAVDISYLQDQWDFAISVPSFGGDTWENIATGEISYDSSGKGMSIIFHEDASYDIIYVQDISTVGCNSSIRAYEHGNYQYDGLTLDMTKTSFKGKIFNCDDNPTAMTETGQRIQKERIDVVFLSQNQLFLKFSCLNRGYIIGCNDNSEYLFKFSRKTK